MTISMYQASVPPLSRALNNLVGILEKGAAYAEAKTIEPTVLITGRLYPDMFPLSRQVQIASDVSRRGVAILAGVEAAPIEDTETTFAQLCDRLHQSIAYLNTFTADQFENSVERDIPVPATGGETIQMKGWPFLSIIVLPNVYFHVTTAYDILRHNGVDLGKLDFLGNP